MKKNTSDRQMIDIVIN